MKAAFTFISSKTLLLFLFSCISVVSILGQTSLEGKVTDAATGEAILFGTVSLYKDDVLLNGVETDLDGNYFFSEIDSGAYDVQVNYIGYRPQIQTGVIIKTGLTNRLDFAISEGVLLDAVEIIEYKVPLIEADHTTSGATVTAEAIRSLPTKSTREMDESLSGRSSSEGGAISIRGSRSTATHTVDGIRVDRYPTKKITAITSTPSAIKSSPDSYAGYASTSTFAERESLPSSGQMTAGEWNDLHNWKDWMTLLENEDYSIMTERFEIFPLERYSVLTVNDDNNVIPNIQVQLMSKNGKVLWQSITDNAGKAELWLNAFNKGEEASHILVEGKKISNIKTIDEGSNTVVLKQDCYSPDKMDIVFTVDATSSMSDEISYLKSELLNVIGRIKDTNDETDYRTGSVFYRDISDTYLTKSSPLSEDESDLMDFVKLQNASGGGDKPEAVEEALDKTLALDWRTDALKIVFLILDAPPHEDETTMERIKSQIRTAAEKGIKLIPITASGIGRETEFLMKFMAMMTNGTYVFITDDSGIGNAHLAPVVKDYEVEKLNDCMVRLISQYSKSYSCDAEIRSTEDVDIKIYPNPSAQFINVSTSVTPDQIKVLSANGMMVKNIRPTEKTTRIELDDLVNGVYTVAIYMGDEVESRQVILLK